MVIIDKNYQRLKHLISLDAGIILKDRNLRKEYEELHLLIEGFKPSCTGCSARSKLDAWKRKFKTQEQVKIKKMADIKPKNTFRLNHNHPRVVIPFTGHVITQESKDESVLYYLKQAKTEEERKRRESFFDKLPDEPKKKTAKSVKR